jgi:maltooligosyltrehalose synthase
MNMLTATYRIQFNPAFGFQAAQLVISYHCQRTADPDQ